MHRTSPNIDSSNNRCSLHIVNASTQHFVFCDALFFPVLRESQDEYMVTRSVIWANATASA